MSDSDSTAGLEATLAAWDDRLSALERQAAAMLRATRKLRRAVHEGAVVGLPAAVAATEQDASRLQDAVAEAAVVPPLDVADAFASGAYLQELADAAKTAGVTLVQRDGRVSAFPVVLRLEPRAQAVRIGRKLERRIRPSFLVQQLKALQQRGGGRFNARAFLDRMVRAYAILAPQWRGGEGPLVPLADLHEVLTLWPTAAADYPVEEFICDLLRLDREPDARTGRGHQFELGGSTGTKGAKRLTGFDEEGAQHDYFAIRFIAD